MAFDIEAARRAGYTDQEIAGYMAKSKQPPSPTSEEISAPPEPQGTLESVIEYGKDVASNVPGSALQFGKDMLTPILHPIQTAKSFYDLGKGLVQLAIPGEQGSEAKARAVGQFFVERYGGLDKLKETFRTDPVGALSDVSLVLTAGGAALTRAPGMVGKAGRVVGAVGSTAGHTVGSALTHAPGMVGRASRAVGAIGSTVGNTVGSALGSTVGQTVGSTLAHVPGMIEKAGRVVSEVGSAIDPMTMAMRGVKTAGRAAAPLIGSLGTQTGADSLREAYKAGQAGGQASEAFTGQMRGRVPPTMVVDDAKRALSNMRADRAAQYRAGMAGVKADTTVLNFNDIQKAVDSVADVGQYKGKVLNKSAVGVWDQIREVVDDWKASSPADFHTAEGFDALKRAIGDIRDSTQFGTPARRVTDDVYHAVRSEIVKQAPEYAKAMKGYEQASDLLTDIEKTLSLNPRASVDTALRKLQSVMRNNAYTNYGRRADLAKILTEAGAESLIPGIAGQAMNSLTPRGLAPVTTVPATMGAAYLGHPEALAALPFQSPRLMGEAAHGLGVASNVATEERIRSLARVLMQSGRVANQ